VVGYGERQLAKQAGFRWNDPVEGAWTRRLSARQVQRLGLPFAIEVLEA
jgi:DNA polymerase-3 subunit epsilon